ncbi:DUF2812 domain-containing protein [Anaerotignum sp.]|uniref:DUF2812 domain-containing protein n=1 Tax=Anaerotignum sp. TaxID=2039241 RepID=UPI00289C46C4|nr:DUF2812 domain-containing protein [Anaerotignum sp.]
MKTVRRIIPAHFLSGNIYDIAQTEAYLSHMASKGFFIKKIGLITSFEKGIPEKTKYRLEPVKKEREKPDEEIREYYETQGWKYICTFCFFQIYQAIRTDAMEIHTEPITQSETFASLNKRVKYMFWYIAILSFTCISVTLYALLHIHPVYNRVKSIYNIAQIPMILMFLYAICSSFWDYRKIKKLKQQLEAGIKMKHDDKYKPSYRQYFSLAVPIIILAYMFLASQYNKKVYWDESLFTYNGNLPTISITALEIAPNFSIEYGKDFVGDNISYVSHHWTELSPQAYQIKEQGRLEGKMKKANAGVSSPLMETEYYNMRFQFLSKILFDEMLQNKVEKGSYDIVQYHKMQNTEFDEVTLVDSGDIQMLFARAGEDVIYVSYHGNGSLESVVEQIYDAVTNFKDNNV